MKITILLVIFHCIFQAISILVIFDGIQHFIVLVQYSVQSLAVKADHYFKVTTNALVSYVTVRKAGAVFFGGREIIRGNLTRAKSTRSIICCVF